MNNNNGIQVVAVTGGKGGVGKTNIAVNLGASLSNLGKRTYLLDADFGLSNVDLVLGLKPKQTLANVLAQECQLEDIVLDGPFGLKIIPGASGIQSLAELSTVNQASIINGFSALSEKLDVLVIDTAAGIADPVLRFALAANEIIVVVTDEPASMADAYALMKILHLNFGVQRFRIVVNMSSSWYEAKKLFAKLTNVTDRYLNVVLHFLGWIPEDELVRKAIKQQCAVVEAYPSCKSAQSFRSLAESFCALPSPKAGSGHVQFFIEQFMKTPIAVQ
jgi:flagellar biosynthesis protein FlhG